MTLRNNFIETLPLSTQEKDFLKNSAKHMNFNSMLNILVELTKPAYQLPQEQPAIVELAAGYAFVIHACIILAQEKETSIYKNALHRRRDTLLKDQPNIKSAIEEIEQDSQLWYESQKNIELANTFSNSSFCELAFEEFEGLMLKHRSYGFISHIVLQQYASSDNQLLIFDIITDLIKGFGYFYDVVPYNESQASNSFALLYTQHIMQKEYDIDCKDEDYETMQRYMMASGVYSFMLEKAETCFWRAYEQSTKLGKYSGQRQFILKRLAQNAKRLSLQCEESMA